MMIAMLELLQLTEAVLVATTLTIGVVATPAALMTGQDPPDLTPLLEHVEDKETLSNS
jgi:hypothetical protein|tara:strand:+ start:225 stop:398 length:174 start_codon:yes stop_codon:yes gene_type:complete